MNVGIVRAQTLGMAVNNSIRRATVFDTRNDIVVGSVLFGSASLAAGDCALYSDEAFGFLTEFRSWLWAIDADVFPPGLAPAPNPIPISNPGGDVDFTPDGRFLVTCDGSALAPVSVVDTALRTEVSTFDLGSDCNAVDVCDDGSVLVTSFTAGRVRRLTLGVEGTLLDTGESLPVTGPQNVLCAPGSASGVVVRGADRAVDSFLIPGLIPVSSRPLNGSTSGLSAVFNAAGDRLYARTNSAVDLFSFEPRTGIPGISPLFTIALSSSTVGRFGVEYLVLDQAGAKLYVTQTSGVGVHDAVTGALIRTLADSSIGTPGGVCSSPGSDIDGDGLKDAAEQVAGTDPNDADSDGDGLLDGFEVGNGFDPIASGDDAEDPDGDGLDNLSEQISRTAPDDPDTDSDGLSDGDEVRVIGSHPRLADTDADGVDDPIDLCPLAVDPDQDDIVHPGGGGDACDDPEGDGVADQFDSCPDLANADQADQDGDGVGDVCDPFPALALRVRPQTLLAAPTGTQWTPVRYRLEDRAGTLQEGIGPVRVTLTLTGSATFAASASPGALLAGGGTNRALVEFENGIVLLSIRNPVSEPVALGGEDSLRSGVDFAPRSVRFRAGSVFRYALAMVVNALARATVIDTKTDTVLGVVSIPSGTVQGDCTLPDGLGEGLLPDTGFRAWVVDVEDNPPWLSGAPNPIPMSIPGIDTALSADSRYLVACDGNTSTQVSVLDPVWRVQVGTFSLGGRCNAVDVCDDGSVLVADFSTARIRRLILDDFGTLQDTGEVLTGTLAADVACAPGSRAGIAIGSLSGPPLDDRTVVSFTIPGMALVSTHPVTGSSSLLSSAISPAGTRVYVRGNTFVDVLSLDPGTGLLGTVPLFSIAAPQGLVSAPFGVDRLALDGTGHKLYLPSIGGVRVHDASSGELLRTITNPAVSSQSGICSTTAVDADDDGLADADELIWGSDPRDPDSDEDELRDGFEAHHGFDPLQPGEQGQDPDSDGLDNLGEQVAGTNPGTPDSDGDGLSDGIEVLVAGSDPLRPDTDNDGDADGADNCPVTPNAGQEDAVHPNGIGDACDDPDGDSAFDTTDNCPDTANATQVDADDDGPGDACDSCPSDPLNDIEADGFCYGTDICPEVADPDQLDADADEVGDACDGCPSISNPSQLEALGCLDFTENGGQCLETRIDLAPGVGQGRLTLPANGTDIPFDAGSLPPLVDIGTLPEGDHELCVVGVDGLPAGQLLASTSSGQLVSIDTGTGDGTLIAMLPSAASDIEVNSATGRAFLATNRELREFDIDTGAALGQARGIGVVVSALEYVGSRLYGSTSAFAGGPGDLRRIDPDTGATSFIGPTGTPVLTGLAWDAAGGVLYGVTGGGGTSNLVRVNLETGSATLIGPTGRQLGSLQFGSDGMLYAGGTGVNSGRILRIHTASGDGTLVGLSGFGDLTGLTLRQPPSSCQPFTKTTEEVLAINGAACGGPTALATAAASTECTSPLGASVTLDGSGSTDPNSTPGTQDDIVSYEWLENPGAATPTLLGTGPVLTLTLPLGGHALALRVTDSFGETDLDEFQVAVVDTVAPALTLGVTPIVLWPPNHRMVKLDTTPAASDLCSTPAVTLHAITNSEPDDAEGNGDGNTADDIQKAATGTLDRAFELRAERDGTGNGRFYTVLYRAVDAAGNTSWAESVVTVPHSQGGTTEPLTLQVRQNGAGTLVSWSEVSGALYYNVIRGRVRQIAVAPSAIDLGPVSCLASRATGHGTMGTADTASPASGDAFFYLAEYHDGWRASSYGTAEAHAPALPGPGACP